MGNVKWSFDLLYALLHFSSRREFCSHFRQSRCRAEELTIKVFRVSNSEVRNLYWTLRYLVKWWKFLWILSFQVWNFSTTWSRDIDKSLLHTSNFDSIAWNSEAECFWHNADPRSEHIRSQNYALFSRLKKRAGLGVIWFDAFPGNNNSALG